jgi:hypothetical protein
MIKILTKLNILKKPQHEKITSESSSDIIRPKDPSNDFFLHPKILIKIIRNFNSIILNFKLV